MRRWREVGHIAGRIATETDVKLGNAVFFVEVRGEARAAPHPLQLPCCAILREPGRAEGKPVIAIQAEVGDRGVVVGYRGLAGGNGVCALEELEILLGPDQRFQVNLGESHGV
jgi:hypothetical protein